MSADHPISYLYTLLKTRSESIEATLRKRRILFAGFVVRMEDTRLPECVIFGEMVGGTVRGARKRSGWGQSFRHQRRPVDDCSPGRGGMAQNGRTRGSTFHDEMDRCRENQGCTPACSGMLERDGKNQEEGSPNQAGSCWFARPCWLATSGANLYTPGVWFTDAMAFFLWCYVCSVLLRFSSLCFR